MRTLTLLFAIFIIVPLVEIWLLIKVGGLIGAPMTIFFVVLTAVIGAALVRAQGISMISRIRGQLQQGELPAVAMFEGLFLLIAGALLLTPGFFTDTIGFLCLLPPLRRGLIRSLIRRGFIHTQTGPDGSDPKPLEGKWRRLDD